MSKKQYPRVIALFGISILLWWSPIAKTLFLALQDDQYTHILLIVPISAALIFVERKRLNSPRFSSGRQPATNIVSGILFVVAIGLLIVTTRTWLAGSGLKLTYAMTGLVVWWLASFIACFGLAAFRIFLLPVCFLFWIIPWPQSFLDLLIRLLQQYSASGVSWTFQLFGIPVLRNGVILSIPGLTIEVARECSSIRSSLILLVSSIVLAQFFLRSIARKTIVTLIAVPLSVAKNVVRIFTLSMLGVHVNRGFLTGRLHHQGGVVFYMAALGVIFLLIYWFQRQEADSPPRKVLKASAR